MNKLEFIIYCGIGGFSPFSLFKDGQGWYPSPVPKY